MATSRLRRTFAYPTESDDEDTIENGIDQPSLLRTLKTHDTHTTSTYTTLLLLLPLLPLLAHTPLLLRTSTFIPAIAAMTSLLASAYALYFLPLPPVKVSIINAAELKDVGKGKAAGGDGQEAKATRKHVPYISDDVAEILARYIVPVNSALCAVLAVVELWQGRTWGEGMMVGGGYLPGLILVVVLWARRELRVMDMSELERLTDRMKGT